MLALPRSLGMLNLGLINARRVRYALMSSFVPVRELRTSNMAAGSPIIRVAPSLEMAGDQNAVNLRPRTFRGVHNASRGDSATLVANTSTDRKSPSPGIAITPLATPKSAVADAGDVLLGNK